jgi:hypothetical protein
VGVATRRDKETTRQLLLETGFEMMLERGLEVGWGVRLAEVTERVGLTTGAAYQIWNGSRTRHGSGGQDRFHHDLALYAMDRLISETSVAHTATVRKLADEGASLDRVLRTVAPDDFATIAEPAECAVFMSLIAAAASDPELARAGATSYRLVTEHYCATFTKLLDHYGLEVVPPNSIEDVVVSIIALGDGLAMRSIVDPDAVTDSHESPADASDDACEPWHLFAIGTRALIGATTRPRTDEH